jgi:hypothetical protein
MLYQAAMDKLHALRLTGMVEGFQKQLDEPESSRSQLRTTLRDVPASISP